MNKLPIVLVGASIAGCGNYPESFEPSERVTAISPEGTLAAEYPIRGTTGDLGEVKVWSRGTFRGKVNGQERTLLHVGFDIENSTDRPLMFDTSSIRLESAQANSKVFGGLVPASVVGQGAIAGNSDGTVDAYFELPHGISPQEMDSFRVRWDVSAGAQTFSQRTPFLEVPDYSYAYPYYDPFFDPYWGGYWPVAGYGYYGPYRHL